MFKGSSKWGLFLIIFVMSVFAIAGGLAGTLFFNFGRMPQGLHIGEVSIEGLTRQEAIKKVRERYSDSPLNGHINIKYKNIDFLIKYEEIDASINYEETINAALKAFPGGIGENLMRSIAAHEKKVAYPVFTVNEFKLKSKLEELSSLIESKPSNADIYIENGKVVKVNEVLGKKLNIENSVKKVLSQMGQHTNTPIIFDDANEYEVETVYPDITIADLEGADEIISQHSTLLKSSDSEYSAKIAAYAINKVVILPAMPKEGLKAGTFSFNKYLWQANDSAQKEDEGYDQVASTLYAAVLKAGIEQSEIKRIPHKVSTDYIEPGLDACVGTADKDFVFSNSLNSRLVIFAEISDDKVTVSIVGRKADSNIEISIETEILQEYTPSVISVENQDLKQGESKIISNGKPGYKVRTFQIVKNQGKVEAETLISTDMYDPVDAIVQLGPNTTWNGYK